MKLLLMSLLGLFLLQNICHAADVAPVNVEIPLQSGWVAPSASPILPGGALRSKALWNDPCVLKVNNQYVMYMTSSVAEPFQPPVLPYRAVSSNGINNWKLEPSHPLINPKGTDFVSIETPSVVVLNGVYHMFFTGIYKENAAPPMAIGHAISTDGIKWKVSPHAVLKATGKAGDWNSYLVGEPGAIVIGKAIYVYFSAVSARSVAGQPPQLQVIGLATTYDGETFSKPVKVLSQSALFPASQGYAGYSTPSPFLLNNQIHLVFDVARYQQGANPEWQQVALSHAVSKDGLNFIQDKKAIYTTKSFTWTSGEILAPFVMIEGRVLKMWFAGHVHNDDLGPFIQRGFKGPEFGIGYATHSTAGLGK